MTFFFYLLLAGLLAGVYYSLKSPAGEKSAVAGKTTTGKQVDLAALADKVEPVMDKLAHPGDILANADFETAVAALASDAYTIDQASNYALGANWILTCIGYEALSRRDDSADTV